MEVSRSLGSAAVPVKARLDTEHWLPQGLRQLYERPGEQEKRADIKSLFAPLLREIGVQWPYLYDDLQMFLRLKEIKWGSLKAGRRRKLKLDA
eukprot:s4535_g5.t1